MSEQKPKKIEKICTKNAIPMHNKLKNLTKKQLMLMVLGLDSGYSFDESIARINDHHCVYCHKEFDRLQNDGNGCIVRHGKINEYRVSIDKPKKIDILPLFIKNKSIRVDSNSVDTISISFDCGCDIETGSYDDVNKILSTGFLEKVSDDHNWGIYCRVGKHKSFNDLYKEIEGKYTSRCVCGGYSRPIDLEKGMDHKRKCIWNIFDLKKYSSGCDACEEEN